MTINLLKKLLWIKGSILLPLLSLTAGAQPSLFTGPVGTGLAGSVTARCDDLWGARANPATLAGRPRSLQASFTPSSLGIEGYADGGMMASLDLSDDLTIGASAQGIGVRGYREISYSLLTACDLPGGVTLGATLSLRSLAIERYGDAVSAALDLGTLIRLSDRIRFGGAFRNITRAPIAGEDLPQGLSAGFAFDLVDETTLSIDLIHELRRSATVAIGISTRLEGIVVRGGLAEGPGTIALGVGYEIDAIRIDYGGSYTSPLGLRHAIGIEYRW